MAIDKPIKPTNLMPRNFGGDKNQFSENLIANGFEPNIPQTYNGDNLNYQLNATGEEFDYCEKVSDYLCSIANGRTPFVDSNNKLSDTQIGIRVHNLSETYGQGEWVLGKEGNTKNIYESLIPSNTGNAITDTTKWKLVPMGATGVPIGAIFPCLCTANYVPDGAVACDGTEYTKEQFPHLWSNFLTAETPLLPTCTYTEYQTHISTYGSCAKFGIDLTNNKFKVPTIKDGDYITQAKTNDVLNKEYKESLPNIEGSITNSASGLRGGSGLLTAGALSLDRYGTYSYQGFSSSGGSDRYGLSFNASLSSSTYQDGAKVQGDNIRLRYFVQVANGTISDNAMDWSAWASSLQGKANVNLDNLSDTGRKVIDGQWVAKVQVLSTATAVGTYTVDLSDYLPNDNYNYEVFLHDSLMQKSVTDTTHIDIVAGGVSVYFVKANSASVYATNSAVFPVDNTRKIKLVISARKADNNSLTAYYYRRIGTNS